MNDVAGFKQNSARGDQNEDRADRQMQGRQLQEDISNHTNQHHHNTRHQHTAKERHIFAGGQHIRRAAEEHQRRSAQCHSDYVTHSSRQVGVQNWSEDISQKTGKGECGDNPGRLIRRFVGQEHQTIHTHQRQNQTRRWQHQHRTGSCGNRRKGQRQAQQKIGITQHLMGAKQRCTVM